MQKIKIDMYTIRKYKALIKPAEIMPVDFSVNIKPAIIKKRGDYFITAFYNGCRQVIKEKGWIFIINGIEAGATKKSKSYHVTDIKTGLLIGEAAKLADVPGVVEGLAERIREKHEDFTDKAMRDLMDDISAAYRTM